MNDIRDIDPEKLDDFLRIVAFEFCYGTSNRTVTDDEQQFMLKVYNNGLSAFNKEE